jgi:predicted glycogen debranching enzyme
MVAGMISFEQSTCQDLSAGGGREWLETNGLGGYASSTILGLNTRRYHGLLVAATQAPAGRMVLLSKMEETVVAEGRRYDLSTNRYPGAIYPEGYKHLSRFRLDPFPTFVYEAGGFEIEKRVFLVHGRNTVVLEYDFRGGEGKVPPACLLEVRPLIAFRDFHAMAHWNDVLDRGFSVEGGRVALRPYQGVPTLHIMFGDAGIEKTGDWYYNFEYEVEFERGFNEREDLFNPLLARYTIAPGRGVSIIASLEEDELCAAPALRARELARRRAVVSAAPVADTLIAELTAAADQFIVRRGDLETVIAGYHWFGDWGRDTMIALPGLVLATGRFDVAKKILQTFTRHVDQGMLPNRFPDDGGNPEYNTVDAVLWLFEAVRAFVSATDDWAFAKEHFYSVLEDVIAWHQRGTRFGIKVDDDGLLCAGEPGSQLTWMDAKIGDFVVTPRHGKPVEIQALWYNALRIMEQFSRKMGAPKKAKNYASMAARAAVRFNEVFWNGDGGYLYDVIDGDRRDASIRPNQILAVSLGHSMLDADRARSVVAVVERELFTPLGLRSLATGDPCYQGRYAGDAATRDKAYHQGTIWPWLLGPFFTAWLKVRGEDSASRATVKLWLSQFEQHLHEAGLGQVSEIFDGDPPFRPRGCIAQAWSVAELSRVAVALAEADRTAMAEAATVAVAQS